MFGGFKASLNFFGKKNRRGVHSELSPDMTVSGAYRTSRDDSFGYRNSFEQAKKSTASEELVQQMRPIKSAADLSKVKSMPPHLRHSAVEVSRDPRGAPPLDDPRNGAQNTKLTKTQEREQRRLEKQRLAEQKAREKQAQEQAKQERLRQEREKKDAQPTRPDRKRERKPDRKKKAPQPHATTPAAPAPPAPQQYSTNTLESSISRSSGPPPYSDVPRSAQMTTNAQSSNSSGNVTFSKPADTGSWDMISQHRQQTIRPTTVIGGGGNKNKQMVMDLNYNFEATSQPTQNSEA